MCFWNKGAAWPICSYYSRYREDRGEEEHESGHGRHIPIIPPATYCRLFDGRLRTKEVSEIILGMDRSSRPPNAPAHRFLETGTGATRIVSDIVDRLLPPRVTLNYF